MGVLNSLSKMTTTTIWHSRRQRLTALRVSFAMAIAFAVSFILRFQLSNVQNRSYQESSKVLDQPEVVFGRQGYRTSAAGRTSSPLPGASLPTIPIQPTSILRERDTTAPSTAGIGSSKSSFAVENSKSDNTSQTQREQASSPTPSPKQYDHNNTHPYDPSRFPQDTLDYPGFREATIPYFDKNHTTCFWMGGRRRTLYAGLRNQMVAWTGVLMTAVTKYNCTQMILDLKHRDFIGTDLERSKNRIDHQALFDIPYFNSLYDRGDMPIRWVRCDGEYSKHRTCKTATEVKIPQHTAFATYNRYSELTGKGDLAAPGQRHRVDWAILKRDAYRPHPWLREIMKERLQEIFHNNDSSTNSSSYFTLHARVEPDMLRHPVCRDQKVSNLTRIFEMLEEAFSNPPAPFLFLPLNRNIMVEEGDPNNPELLSFHNETNYIAVENLQRLNRAEKEGLWGGRVQVFGLGIHALIGTRYELRPHTAAALLDYQVALESKVFIGTEISTFSSDLMIQRFYRSNLANYKILPEGIHEWTNSSTLVPEAFHC